MTSDRFRLHAVGGLCNRLRAILSYRAVLGDLTVVWEPDEYVSHGRFRDVFLPIQGVDFVDSGWWMKEDFAPHPDAPAGWEDAYRLLHPVDTVHLRMTQCVESRNSYLAVHIRRTDHVPDVSTHGGNMTPWSDFLEWAKQTAEPIYVATDNGVTQRNAYDAWPLRFMCCTRLGGSEEQLLTDHSRNGTLADAVVDLFVCSQAREFKGSNASSFTDTIEILRRLRG